MQAVVGRVGDTDELHDVVTVTMHPDGAGRYAAEVALPHAGRWATPCGCCPGTACWPPRPSWARSCWPDQVSTSVRKATVCVQASARADALAAAVPPESNATPGPGVTISVAGP